MMKKVFAADLFCGAGGTSSGLQVACNDLGLNLSLVAINHWETAIATHSANHQTAIHYCQQLKEIDPLIAIPKGKLDLLMASPECTSFSNSRGSKPMSEKSRASAKDVIEWCRKLRPHSVLIENVKEFKKWGRLNDKGRPLKNSIGEDFLKFINALERLGYNLDYRILNAANFGDPTDRKRLFIQARRKGLPITWPEPTHCHKSDVVPLFGIQQTWRTSREIIDWNIPSYSIFNRKKPLVDKTLNRILNGLRKICNWPLNNNIDQLKGLEKLSALFESIQAFTSNNQLFPPILLQPFLIKYYHTGTAKSLDEPLDTITTVDRFGLVTPVFNKGLDICLRMLEPSELARAMSFPVDYKFSGNRREQVRQIGNAVPVQLSRALCNKLLSQITM